MDWLLPEGIDTPALVVYYDTLIANISSMASRIAARGVALRPHAKTHKCPQIAELQVGHGAVGLTVASLGEADVFSAHGFEDIFIAYPIFASPQKAPRLRALAERVRLKIGVDSVQSASVLAKAIRPETVSVMIEIDSGQHRTGVLPDAAADLAVHCRSLGLKVGGVFTHGGHSYAPGAAESVAVQESQALGVAAGHLAEAGFGDLTVSAGSTPTAVGSATGAVTEERPGTYVFNDNQQLTLGTAGPQDIAAAIVATVVSTSVPGQAVIDAGSKSLASDRPSWLTSHGIVPDLGNAPVVALSECHGLVRLGDQPPPAVGSLVRVVPNHICTAVNLFDSFEVISGGRVVDHWTIPARGHLN
jgi:D-serine deaminase-like pyridoxal phosphate-dependent protein